jgi:hypothetical protein
MRRPPEAGLAILLLLGVSGCAAVEQRSDWPPPFTTSGDGADSSAIDELSRWARVSAPVAAPADAEAEYSASALLQANAPSDPWSEGPSSGLLRYFPTLSRLLNGDASASGNLGSREGSPPAGDLAFNGVYPRWLPPKAPTARDDQDVRPAYGPYRDDAASSSEAIASRPPDRAPPPLLPIPMIVPFRPHSLPDSAGDVALDVSKVNTRREDAPSWASDPQALLASARASTGSVTTEDSLTNRSSATPREAAAADESAQAERAHLERTADSSLVPVSAPSAWGALLAMSPVDEPSTSLPPAVVENPTPAANSPAQPESDTNQLSPPPASELVPAPVPDPGSPPPASPPPPAPEQPSSSAPDATEADAQASVRPQEPPAQPEQAPQASQQPQPTNSSAESERPQPPRVASATAAAASSAAVAATYTQSIYASPPPTAPPPPRRTLLSWIFGDESSEPHPSPQLPPATFPRTYDAYVDNLSHVASPSKQAPAPSAPAPTPPCWEPGMYTKAFLHKLTSWGQGSGCNGCQHASAPSCRCCCCCSCGSQHQPAHASAQAVSAQGASSAERSRATPAAPGVKSAASTSEANTASSAGGAGPSLGTEQGDVSQGGRSVGTAASQKLDEAPQG